jgi:hypothetical protein
VLDVNGRLHAICILSRRVHATTDVFVHTVAQHVTARLGPLTTCVFINGNGCRVMSPPNWPDSIQEHMSDAMTTKPSALYYGTTRHILMP